jgi:polyisoprenoid-binding protein YceI
MLIAMLIAQAFTTHGLYSILPGSRLWMEGDSNFKAWSCEAGQADVSGDPESRATLRIDVPVKGFRCNEALLDDKLREALKANRFPSIAFALESAGAVAGRPQLVRVSGALTVAGQAGTLSLVARVSRTEDGSYLVRGAFPLSMESYGVEPPSAMLGLVKAADGVLVNFDVRVRRNDGRQISRVLKTP